MIPRTRRPGSVRRSTTAIAAAATMAVAAGAGIAAVRAGAGGAEQDPAAAGPARSFGEHPAWDDGKAELCRYDAEEIVEGELRRFEAWSIVVAEHFDREQMVKKDVFDPAHVPVLKLNWFLSIPTGTYRYQQMASLFLRRSDLSAVKAAFSSQEWCGMTFAEWRRDRPGFATHSYWDGEGDRTHDFPTVTENTIFYEQAPLWVRGKRPERARVEKVTLVGKRLGTSKCPPPTAAAAAVFFDGVKDDGGERRIEARLVLDKKVDTYVLAPEFPHTLREWRRFDGTAWKLEQTTRLDYWKFGRNEFAQLLESR